MCIMFAILSVVTIWSSVGWFLLFQFVPLPIVFLIQCIQYLSTALPYTAIFLYLSHSVLQRYRCINRIMRYIFSGTQTSESASLHLLLKSLLSNSNSTFDQHFSEISKDDYRIANRNNAEVLRIMTKQHLRLYGIVTRINQCYSVQVWIQHLQIKPSKFF